MLPFHNEDINVLKKIIEKMVNEFELEYNIQLQEYRDDLKNGLLVHIVPMINRLRYGIEIINPIYFDIVIRHRDVYDSTKVISKVLEDYFNIDINNHEISFIAVYFLGALFKLAPVSSNLKKIIIVCSAGYGTSQLVATQIEKSFNVDILDVISYQEVIASLQKYENVDYIVSTVDIPVLDKNSYLVINPIIADEDYTKLKEVFEERQTDMLVGKTKINLAQNLASIAIDYGVNIDKSQLEYDFLIEIIKAYDTPPLYTNCFEPNLVDVIKKELITFDVESSNWQESIIKRTI